MSRAGFASQVIHRIVIARPLVLKDHGYVPIVQSSCNGEGVLLQWAKITSWTHELDGNEEWPAKE